MSSRARARWHAFALLLALLCSAAVPRVFVVCVSDDDHVSLEAPFEGDPCETKFIFGADSDVAWPVATCTDIPAIQLSALTDEAQSVVVPPILLPICAAAQSEPSSLLRASRWLDAPRPPLLEHLALRTTVLRL